MTIKQVVIGTLVGSSIVAVMVHRVQTAWQAEHRVRDATEVKAPASATPLKAKVSRATPAPAAKRAPWLSKKQTRFTALTSRQLYD